ATTRFVVDFLKNHPKVKQVNFPFLPDHPQYALAQKQLKNNTGQFSIQLKTEKIEEVELFCDSLQHFLMAASWGGHESLIYPVAASFSEGNYKSSLPVNLIRFYIGLEEPEYLVKDLEQAFIKI
ncbi:MAG: PLP-dependent transferase, partial [Hymenobacteraceae bacterium]|nr:PLP-dependent transferase [Hymenobacteraceae bacterium]MDX5394712.1 PLP-dependent transferase [Hymenobacteraceae bacterium]MDX5510745.1 PLP-dependent transferase [Hymenobacteraceae bacterium]